MAQMDMDNTEEKHGKIRDLSDSRDFDGIHADLTERIIGCAFTVHNTLGPGFVESVYENALAVELQQQGLSFKRQPPVEIKYQGKAVGLHRLDILVEDTVIVELKAKDAFAEADKASVLSYLKATGLRIALMLNFGTPRLQVKRLGNTKSRIQSSVRSV